MTTYAVFTPKTKAPVFYFAANFQYSANPLLVLGGFNGDDVDQDGEPRTQATPYRSADAGRDSREAGRLLAEWLASETGEDHGANDPGLQVERITYEVQEYVMARHEYETVEDGTYDTQAEARAELRSMLALDPWLDIRVAARNRTALGSLEALEQHELEETEE